MWFVMPLLPSPLAAATLLAVKATGYGAFAMALNRRTAASASPLAFGAAKTVFGFAGGFSYLLILQAGKFDDLPGWMVFAGAAPIRWLVWAGLLRWFYGLKGRRLALVSTAGVACSYLLDLVVWLLYTVVPGMVMPVC